MPDGELDEQPYHFGLHVFENLDLGLLLLRKQHLCADRNDAIAVRTLLGLRARTRGWLLAHYGSISTRVN